MKSFLFSTVLSLCFLSATAQNVSINNDGSAPDPKAQLDVKSANKGVLFPRITDLSAITGSVPLGLLVFVTDGDRGFYYNASALAGTPNWKKISSGDDAYWQYASPNYLYWNGAANVGIGTATPLMPLHVSRASDTALLLLENRTTLATDVTTGLYFKTGTRYTGVIRTIGTSGTDARLGLFTYTSFNQNTLRESMSILDNGNVGIGNTSPTAKLSVQQNSAATGLEVNQSGSGLGGYFYSATGTGVYAWTGSGTQPALYAQSSGVSLVTTGTVGVGTSTPTEAGLVVDKKTGAVGIMVGSNTNGVAIESAFPGIGFNSFYNAGRKTIGLGYGGWLGQNPSNGDIYFQSNTASVAAGTAISPLTRLLIDKDGDIGVEGNTAPHVPLSFANTVGSKISFYGNTATDNYGIGIQGSLLQLYTNNNAADIAFGFGGSAPLSFGENMRIKGNGRVGIGTNNPSEKLDVSGRLRLRKEGAFGGGVWIDGPTTSGLAFIGMEDNNTLGFYSGNFGWGMHYDLADGTMRLGTTQKASGYLLNIGGKAIAEEVRVQLRAAWPDYVFKNNYRLMPLSQLETFIKQNNHLPNIPKAEVLEKEGTDLGEMQRKMMEKIEELSLYVIDLNKKIEAQRQEIDFLKTQTKQ